MPSSAPPPPAATRPRTSVPVCRSAGSGPVGRAGRRSVSGDVVAIYVAALVYVAFDLVLFHTLSGWLVLVFEGLELAPIVLGVALYWRVARRRGGRLGSLPKILTVPLISTAIQVQILLIAGFYRHVGLT